MLVLASPSLAVGLHWYLTAKHGWMGISKSPAPPNGQATVKALIEKANGSIKRPEFDSALSAINATLSGIRAEMRAVTAAIADLDLKLSERMARLEERKK